MKNATSILLLLMISFACLGQKNKKPSINFFDSAGNSVKEEKAARFFTVVTKINDTCYQFENYGMMTPMRSTEHYKDRQGTIRHGRSAFVRPDGSLDSTGIFVNGKANGVWLYFNTEGYLVDQKDYNMGELIPAANLESSADIELKPEAPPRFKDGSVEWQKYLIQNLRYPPYALEKRVIGRVIIFFVVDQKGRVQEDIILKSVEYTLDNEARRLVYQSPAWIPGSKNGTPVKAYQTQAIAFQLQ